MRLGQSREFARLHLSCCDRRIPLFAQDMVGERFDGFSGRCAEIVSLRFKLAKAAVRCATGDANRRIGWGGCRWDFFRGLARRQVARRGGQIADKKGVYEGERRSICCCACAGRRWRAASRLRPIFSAGDDHRPAGGAKLRHAEACTKAAPRQAETRGRDAPTGEVDGTLSRADIRAGLGHRQRRRIHGRNHVGLPDRRSVLNAAVAPQFIQAPRNSEL
jgi:hypothetical protein